MQSSALRGCLLVRFQQFSQLGAHSFDLCGGFTPKLTGKLGY